MSCFWDALLTKIPDDSYKLIGVEKPKSAAEMLKLLQLFNVMTINVSWQGEIMYLNELQENYRWVETYSDKVTAGTLVSSQSPFLMLVCQLFKLNIDHIYNGHEIKYIYCADDKLNKKLLFKASKTHFT